MRTEGWERVFDAGTAGQVAQHDLEFSSLARCCRYPCADHNNCKSPGVAPSLFPAAQPAVIASSVCLLSRLLYAFLRLGTLYSTGFHLNDLSGGELSRGDPVPKRPINLSRRAIFGLRKWKKWPEEHDQAASGPEETDFASP